jgi:hypothetical protein
MSDIFFPLRSNSAWFLKEETKTALEKRIKNCIMLYDQIHFQNALYQCTVWENGAFDMMLPPKSIGFDRNKIRYFTPGVKSGLFFGKNGEEPKNKIISGEAKFSYHVDFFPIIKKAGMLEAEYIKFQEIELNDEYKKKSKRAANNELKGYDFESLLGGNSFFRQKVLESLYIDSTLSAFFQVPFVIDQNTGPAISLIRNNIIDVHEGAVKDIFLNNWISIGLPDFSEYSWEEIDKMHRSKSGLEFREMIDRIVQAVTSEHKNISELKDLAYIVEQNFTKELVSELISHLPTPKKVVLNLGLNILPFGAGMVAGGIKDSIELINSKRSWVSLLNINN